jgi:hypothetical protein
MLARIIRTQHSNPSLCSSNNFNKPTDWHSRDSYPEGKV